jgi:hypothetical protein
MMSTKDPATTIDPVMTGCQPSAGDSHLLPRDRGIGVLTVCLCCLAVSALAVYSLLFMRWAIAISPPNYPLLVCHIANETAQLVQLGRYAASEKKPAQQQKPPTPIID